MNPDLAIAICTHNPQPSLLERTLNSILSLSVSAGRQFELVLVDNNSHPPLLDIPQVGTFLNRMPKVRVVVASRQGIVFARMAAYQATCAPWILFVDDDNELHPDYLQNLFDLIGQNPEISAWGAGAIQVHFTGSARTTLKLQFGHRTNINHTFTSAQDVLAPASNNAFARLKMHFMHALNPALPPGMGLALQHEAFTAYLQSIQNRPSFRIGRSANFLGGAEDVQIYLEILKKGFKIGVSPRLQLNHWIPPRRTAKNCIQQTSYASGREMIVTLEESCPEMSAPIINAFLSSRHVLTALTIAALRDMIENPGIWARVAQITGRIEAACQFRSCLPHPLVPFLIKKLELDGRRPI
ncbi:MAG TPA: glycosyltransferase [Anaerolineaceae bacterium]|nr:glycosyltransferase [Anaerolineaceae bacterium]HPN52225.1 glycosyltransferase [Anaerolineaceae bacterium]